MVTATFAIKPYLARYMHVRYGQSLELLSHNNPPSRLPIPIHLSHLTPIYHFLHQLSVPHPQGVSWKETGNITFVLPSPRQGKNPEVYNYFGQDSIFIIEKEEESLIPMTSLLIFLKNILNKFMLCSKIGTFWFQCQILCLALQVFNLIKEKNA